MNLILWTREHEVARTGWVGSVRIVRLEPGQADADLRGLMRDLALPSGRPRPRLVLSVGEAFLTSDAIGVLVAAHGQHRAAGGEMVICNLNRHVRQVLALCKLETLIRVFDTETEAIEYLRGLPAEQVVESRRVP